ncbi:MAG: ABC transporter ATP-binding protein [Deltaproteobacteria bacterium]|nr:ABC transporter ATP-binding protein [Deltaproteobacteria bacterium]
MAEPLLRVEGLVKDYYVGSQVIHALGGISAAVDQGEFVAVMGPSGSGKSTFMNLLGCLDKPTGGRYILEGEDISSLRSDQLARIRNRKIGFVFQTFNLLARTTALDNVCLPLMYGGIPRRRRIKKAEAVLEAVGLSDRSHHLPTQLSGGQQQRVAIARALVNDPALILADEPTGALDTRTGCEIMSVLQRLNQKGITVVLVTHEKEIAQFARRSILFRDGHIVGDDGVQDTCDADSMLLQEPESGEGETT